MLQYKPNVSKKRYFGPNVSLTLAIFQSGIQGFVIRKGINDGLSFAHFINKLLKYLKSKSIYQIKAPLFILDNASFHKNFWLINKFISYKCQFLFTAPNTPQNNPIEYLFSDLKRFIRKIGPTNQYVLYNFDYILNIFLI